MSYPSVKELLENPTSNRLLEVHPSSRSQLYLIFLFIGSVVASYYFIRFIETSVYASYIPVIKHISPRFIVIVPIIMLLEIARRLHNDLYIFGLHRLTHLRGRLSFSYNVPVVKYSDIRAINVMQDFWGRILNYGDISIGTAAYDGNELIITGVLAPVELATLLDQLRSHSLVVESKDHVGNVSEE